MGSKIFKAIDQNNRSRPVQQNQINLLIKYYILALSLFSSLSLGYIQHENNTNTQNYSQIILMIIATAIISMYNLNKILIRLSILIFVLVWIPYLEWLLNIAIKSVFICLVIAIFGQFRDHSGKWLLILVIAKIGGGIINQFTKVYNHHRPSLVVRVFFATFSLMCVFLLTTGILYKKSKHPLPVSFVRFPEFVKKFQQTLWYGFVFFLLSLGFGRHQINGIKFQLVNCVGFIMSLLIQFLVPNVNKYRYYYFMFVITSSFSQLMGQQFGRISLGLIQGLKVTFLVNSLGVERRLGSGLFFLGITAGTIIPMHFDFKKFGFMSLQVIGLCLAMVFMIIRERLIKSQYQQLDRQI